MKKLDFIIIAVLLIAAGGLYFSGLLRPGSEGAYGVVYVDGKEVQRYDLSQNTEDTITGVNGTNVIKVQDGKISVVSADCRDQICVNHLPINRENESIVCLPHKVVIEIENGEDNSIDAVVQ